MAVIEALACGTPVVAMNNGVMPEIIKHGYNGFLADSKSEYFEFANRIYEIDPANCRRSIEEGFTSDIMGQNYIDRYHEVLKLESENHTDRSV